MFTTKVSADTKSALLNKSRADRERREQEKQQTISVIIIQKHFRRFLSNRDLRNRYLAELHNLSATCTAAEMLAAFQKVQYTSRSHEDGQVLCDMCRRALDSLESGRKERWYVSLAVSKSCKAWLSQVGRLLEGSLRDLENHVDITSTSGRERVSVYLKFYIAMCDPFSWKLYSAVKSNQLYGQLLEKFSTNFYSNLISGGILNALQHLLLKNVSRSEPVLSSSQMGLLSDLVMLVFQKSNFDESIWLAMWLSVFSTPSLISRLKPIHMAQLTEYTLTALMSLTANTDKITETCSKEQILFLLLNSVHLLHQALKGGMVIKYPTIIRTLFTLLRDAGHMASPKAAHWHPLLGMCDTAVSPQLTNSLQLLTIQIRLLHSQLFKKFFFQDLLEAEFSTSSKLLGTTRAVSWKQLFSGKCESRLLLHVSAVCSLYNVVIRTFHLYKTDILMSLCCFPDFLSSLWKLVYTEHSQSSRTLARNMATQDTADPFVPLLLLFCSCFGQYFVVLSDSEIYEQEQPFSLKQLGTIGDFVNSMLFNIIWNHYDELKNATVLERVSTCHGLLILLHERDERKRYTATKFWTPKDASPAAIIAELKAGKGRAHKITDFIPWVLPNKKKLEYLQGLIKQEKALKRSEDRRGMECKTILIKIHRRRLFEDGFQHMKSIPDDVLKHHVKIMFVNELGLDEVGIDQDGVLKEFLEETIRHALNPSFGLFSVTEENKWLYPSPLSKVHYEHLDLFHYVGRIIAKAVYEGIVVDLSFAPFFVRQLLHNKNALFSYLDELPSLDSELHKNLMFIKSYQGDIQDLGLTFSVDEQEFGKIVTEELMPGGSFTPVTSTNRISYIHQIAHYKMYTQIHKQTKAFCAGFRGIVNDDWLRMFSLPELQKLISGDCSSIDLTDLKNNVRYLGGYHGNHRVILWFWDITLNEFTEEEKSALLKFVTSCSRPPLMGFSSMSPPFSIRAVDESEEATDMTPGQALRSSFKSFLGLQQGSSSGNCRLPTSSTCFNLLKLPVYRSKATLREKLRYAINCGAGFELS